MDGAAENPEKSWTPAVVYDSSRYSPSVTDVLGVKGYLFEKFNLPIEIIDTIIDSAEYWPHTSTVTNHATSIRAQVDRENQLILRSYPLGFVPTECKNQAFQILPEYNSAYSTMEPQPWPNSHQVPSDATEEVYKAWESTSQPRGEHPCRKVVFTIKSRDQGWGGGPTRGTYNGSYTWFDAGLEKVSSFHESTLWEPREVAPFPQFRINPMEEPQQESASKPPSVPNPPLVCSLRTILPTTVDRSRVEGTQHDYTPAPPAGPLAEIPAIDDGGIKYEFFHPLNPDGTALQKNVTGKRQLNEHTIIWSCDDNIQPDSKEAQELEKVGRGHETGTGDFVRNMKVGDVVTVWAKARYGQWVNYVQEVKIDVYWAV